MPVVGMLVVTCLVLNFQHVDNSDKLIMLLYLIAFEKVLIRSFPGTTFAYSFKSTRIWMDNTKGFPLDELSSEWM